MEKLAAFAVKPANNRRRVESSVVEIDEIDAPLARRRVVEAQRLRLDVQLLVGAAHLKLFKVRIAVEKFVVVRNAVVHVPGVGVVEPVRKPADVGFPVADEEIKVWRGVALREIRGIRSRLRVKWNREDCAENKHYDIQEITGFHRIRLFEMMRDAIRSFSGRTGILVARQCLGFGQHRVEHCPRIKLAVEHNRLNGARVMNVGERVLIEQNESGGLAGLNGSAVVKLSHELSSIARGGLEGGKGR